MSKNYELDGVGTPLELDKGGPNIARTGQVMEARASSGALTRVQGADAVAQDDLTTRRQWNLNPVTQAAWYVDPLAGNDATGDGTIGNPLKTLREVARRFGPQPLITQNTPVFVKADGPPPIALQDGIDFGLVTFVDAAAPSLDFRPYSTPNVGAGTVQSYTALDAATNTPGLIVANEAASLANAANNVVVVDRGGTLLYAAAASDNGDDEASVATFFDEDGNVGTPLPGDTFEVISSSLVSVNGIRMAIGGIGSGPTTTAVRFFHVSGLAGAVIRGSGSSPSVGVRFIGSQAAALNPVGSFCQVYAGVAPVNVEGGRVAAVGCVGQISVGGGGTCLVDRCMVSQVSASAGRAEVQNTYFTAPSVVTNPPIQALAGGIVLLATVGGAAAADYAADVRDGGLVQVTSGTPLVTGTVADIRVDLVTELSWAQAPFFSQIRGSRVLLEVDTSPLQPGPAMQVAHQQVLATDWYIDPVSGDDRNGGLTSGNALRTFAELQRRWGADPVITQDTTVHVLDDIADEAVELSATVSGDAQLSIIGEPDDTPIGIISSQTLQDAASAAYGIILTSVPHGQSARALLVSPSTDDNCIGWADAIVGASTIRLSRFYTLGADGAVADAGNIALATVSARRVYACQGGLRLAIRRATVNGAGTSESQVPVVLRYLRFSANGSIDIDAPGRYGGVEFQACFLDTVCGGTGQVQLTKCMLTSGFQPYALAFSFTGCSFDGGLWTNCVASNNDERLTGAATGNQQYIGNPVRLEGRTSLELYRTAFEGGGFVQLRSPDCFVRASEPFGTTGASYVYEILNGGRLSLTSRPANVIAAATSVFRISTRNIGLDDIPVFMPEIGAFIGVEDEGRSLFIEDTGDSAAGALAHTLVMNGNARQIFFGTPSDWPDAEDSAGVILRSEDGSFDRFNYTEPSQVRRYWAVVEAPQNSDQTSLYSVATNNGGEGIMDTLEN